MTAPPEPQGRAARSSLVALLRRRSTLAALETLHRDMGPVFQIPLPGFNPIMLVGSEANRFMLITAADRLCWRVEGDPVGDLLRDGLLVLDGERHDAMRRLMNPALCAGAQGQHSLAKWLLRPSFSLLLFFLIRIRGTWLPVILNRSFFQKRDTATPQPAGKQGPPACCLLT